MVEDQIWSEKFRPNSLDEVIGHSEQVQQLKEWVGGSPPHVLLHGPAGTGKTASVVGFARDMYGEDWKENVIEMNASDERGIDVVRDQIKSVARQAPSGDYPFKIIYLDECDNLTKDAQSALRRTMEQYSDQTRFFLSCNYPSKLIDPIKSRCTLLPFRRLSDDEINQLLTRILDSEGVDYEGEAVDRIIEYVNGDARRAVQTLQNSVKRGELSQDLIDVVGGQVDEDVVEGLISDAVKGDMESAQDTVIDEILVEVTDYSQFTQTLLRVLRKNEDIPDDVRWYLISRVGNLERDILEGCNPNVQINSFLAEIPVARHSSIPNYD